MKDSAELRELVYFTCYPADRFTDAEIVLMARLALHDQRPAVKVRATEMFKAAMLGLWHEDPTRYNRVGLLALKVF